MGVNRFDCVLLRSWREGGLGLLLFAVCFGLPLALVWGGARWGVWFLFFRGFSAGVGGVSFSRGVWVLSFHSVGFGRFPDIS